MDQQNNYDSLERRLIHLQSLIMNEQKYKRANRKTGTRKKRAKKEGEETSESDETVFSDDLFVESPEKKCWAEDRFSVLDGKVNKRRWSANKFQRSASCGSRITPFHDMPGSKNV